MYTDELVDTIHRLRDDAENIIYKADHEDDEDKKQKAYSLADYIREVADNLDTEVDNLVEVL